MSSVASVCFSDENDMAGSITGNLYISSVEPSTPSDIEEFVISWADSNDNITGQLSSISRNPSNWDSNRREYVLRINLPIVPGSSKFVVQTKNSFGTNATKVSAQIGDNLPTSCAGSF
jgi:hypothetical protein